jgi:hypothetical protein
MVVHLNKFFPEHCAALKEAGTREAIRYSVTRAAHYQIVTERDVCKYTDLMFAFGRDFDQDPELPWAAAILNDENLKDPTGKINILYDEAMKHVRQAGGIEDEKEA